MSAKVVIMRGLPGSGKSHYAKNNFPGAITLSSDHYFINSDGEYVYDPAKIGSAHAWCFKSFIKCLTEASSSDVLVVDNTNISAVEIAPYVMAANAFGVRDVHIITVECDPIKAHSRNAHGVPLETVQKMAAGLELPLPPWWSGLLETIKGEG